MLARSAAISSQNTFVAMTSGVCGTKKGKTIVVNMPLMTAIAAPMRKKRARTTFLFRRMNTPKRFIPAQPHQHSKKTGIDHGLIKRMRETAKIN